MVVEKIRFDEVFDVAARGGHFSFRSRGRTEYGVKLKNRLVPPEGATFAIAFATPGDWTSILGWRDLASNDVVLAHPTWSVWTFALSDIALYGAFFIAAGLLLAGLVGACAVVAAFGGIALYQTRRNRAVKRALLAAGTCRAG